MSKLDNYKGAFFISILIIIVLGFFTIKFYMDSLGSDELEKEGNKISYYPSENYKIEMLLDSNESVKEWVGMNILNRHYITNRFEEETLKEFYLVDFENEVDFSMYNNNGMPYLIRLKLGVKKEYYLHIKNGSLSAVSTHLGGQEATVLHLKENATPDSLIINNWPERNNVTRIIVNKENSNLIEYELESK